mmetsp:Transcript_8622/g.22167  ORF Transcript_8622/g.22167 Transcript_8622/m.22167 type:complete len:231 (+) Transcript_8622:218-910(+)
MPLAKTRLSNSSSPMLCCGASPSCSIFSSSSSMSCKMRSSLATAALKPPSTRNCEAKAKRIRNSRMDKCTVSAFRSTIMCIRQVRRVVAMSWRSSSVRNGLDAASLLRKYEFRRGFSSVSGWRPRTRSPVTSSNFSSAPDEPMFSWLSMTMRQRLRRNARGPDVDTTGRGTMSEPKPASSMMLRVSAAMCQTSFCACWLSASSSRARARTTISWKRSQTCRTMWKTSQTM